MAMWTVHLEGGPRRVNHAAVAIGRKIYSFGGYCSGEVTNSKDPLDVHVLDTNNYRWTKVDPVYNFENQVFSLSEFLQISEESDKFDCTVPFQRYGHTVVEFNGKAYVWGGRNDDYGACNMLHEYDPVKNLWRKVKVDGFIPPSRDGHTAVVWNNQMFVFGGFEEDMQRFSQETYVFNFSTSTWRELHTTDSPPLWRDFHTASVINGIMYIFGGRSDHQGQVGDEHLFHSTHDLYDATLMALNLSTGVWSKPTVEDNGTRPGGRRSHSTWVFDDKMFMFGGYLGTRNVHYNELYCYNPESSSWSVIDVRGTYPTARRRHCSVVSNGKVYLFGGTMPNPATCHPLSTTVYNGNISPSGLADLSDLHVLDFAPTLKTLAMDQVLRDLKAPSANIYSTLQHDVPADLRYEMYCQVTPNNVAASGSYRNDQSG
uniref:Kelch domain-containing protein 3-like n=1 Tax=Caenorhabditis tropicalis TaxID=1561998 RepID=A0A1I7UWE9_9PELO